MLGVVALLALVAGGCRDTCAGPTMRNASLAGPVNTAVDRSLRIAWEPGFALPAAYFDKATVQGEGVASVAHTGDRELTVTLAPGAAPTSLTLEFPDRRAFVDCTHVGMDDHYVVEVTLQRDGDVITGATFRDDVLPGGL